MLVLDFDGVICDSVDECFDVAVDLIPAPGALLSGATDASMLKGFRRYRHWLSDGYHYPALLYLLSIDALADVTNQQQFDAQLSKHRQEIFTLFGSDDWAGLEAVFQSRRAGKVERNPQGWLDSNPLYPVVADSLRQANSSWDQLYIATSKPTAFAERILHHNAINLPNHQIIGKDKVPGAIAKNGHLHQITAATKVAFKDMHFVDDQVSHLHAAAEIGVQRYIAAWGYNDETQRRSARDNGINVLQLDSVPAAFEQALAA